MERRTEHTITTAAELATQLRTIRAKGYAVDDQENEVGVNCIAVPIFLTSPRVPSGAVSVSALAYRTPLPRLVDALPEILSIVDAP
ncbi:MAG TPA: IclR family transcriptional regulator C-terminal domain-containing protein [Pseudonocardiaceae bacterium]